MMARTRSSCSRKSLVPKVGLNETTIGHAASFGFWNAVGFVLLASLAVLDASVNVGVCWGRNSWQPWPPSVVVNTLQANEIRQLKLFGADADILRALLGTDIEVSVMAANEYLDKFAADPAEAQRWLSTNVQPFMFPGGVNIKYLAVGNEPFLAAYNGKHNDLIVPAVSNMFAALKSAGLDMKIKIVVPLNLDILSVSYPPSQATLREDISQQVADIVQFLQESGSAFHVNIYPFYTLHQQPLSSPLPLSQILVGNTGTLTTSAAPVAFIDSGTGLPYTNIFDGSYDAVITVLKKLGFPKVEVVIGEIGWPTDGEGDTRGYASLDIAQRFANGIVRHMSSGIGSPLTPGKQIHGYLFSLTDEDNKTIGPGNFERHWGIFRADGSPKYPLDLTGKGLPTAQLVSPSNIPLLPQKWCVAMPNATVESLASATAFACGSSYSDCTPTIIGGSCYAGGDVRNISSYAFNSFYQLRNQDPQACDFGGVAMVVNSDPSYGNCTFLIGLNLQASAATALSAWRSLKVLWFGITLIWWLHA